MTAGSIQQAGRKRTKVLPSDQAVLVQYNYQCQKEGEYGAEHRAAQELKCSHTHISNVLKRLGVKKPKPKKERDIEQEVLVNLGFSLDGPVPDYEPCPGELVVRQQHAQIAEKLATKLPNRTILCKPELKEVVLQIEGETEALPQSTPLQLPPFETLGVRYGDPTAVPVSNTYYRDDAELGVCISLSGALLMTAVTICLPHVSLLLALLMVGPTLGLWWCFSQEAKNMRYWSGSRKKQPVVRYTRQQGEAFG